MSTYDQEFHSQFERDYFHFLQRRKREQEADLQIITDRKKLKDTIHQVQKCIEISLKGVSKNEDILSEISELSELRAVSKVIESGVFHEELTKVVEKPVKYYRPCMVCSDYHTEEEHGSCQVDRTGTGTSRTYYDVSFERPTYSDYENQPAESIYKWPLVDPYDEVEDLAKEKRVSNLDRNFGCQLIDVLTSTTNFAKRIFRKAKKEKSLSDLELGSCYASIGAAEIERNQLDKAQTSYTEALRIGIDKDDILLQCKALAGLGTLADILNDVESATNSYITALDLLRHQLSTVEVTQLQEVIEEKLHSALRTETF